MIYKKKILNTELIRRLNNNQIEKKHLDLFKNDLFYKSSKSYIYYLKNIKISSNGLIDTNDLNIIKDYLSFNSITKFVYLKKIFLLIKYKFLIIKNISQKKKYYRGKNYLYIHNRNSLGYFHWITDTLIKLVILPNHVLKKYIIILPKIYKKKVFIDCLKYHKVNFVFLENKKTHLFEEISYLGELHRSGSPRPKILAKFSKKLALQNVANLNVFISRNKSSRRKLKNENNLIAILKKYNFEIVYMEELNFKKQIEIMSKTKIVVGLHGAGLTNIIWMKKNSHLIEIKPKSEKYLNCYFNISQALGLNYHYSICAKANYFSTSKTSDYNADILDLEKKIQSILKNEKKNNFN